MADRSHQEPPACTGEPATPRFGSARRLGRAMITPLVLLLRLPLAALAVPFAFLSPRARDVVGLASAATAAVSLGAAFLQPALVTRRDITEIIRDQANAVRARAVQPERTTLAPPPAHPAPEPRSRTH